MRIISYNVNGIRSALSKNLSEWLVQSQADVLCLQETKAQTEQVDTAIFENLGYHHYWFSAEKKGYSGVAILTKEKPNKVVYGTGIPYMDHEGRNIRIDFDEISIMSMYLPSASNVDRLDFKLQYMEDILTYLLALRQEIPNLVISGDYNICHKAIDIHDPIRNAKTSGFLPIERQWLTRFIEAGFIDSFRHFHQEPHKYSWWSYRANARNNNKGWRIDYNMVSQSLQPRLKQALILPEVNHSDHCPIVLDLI